MDMITIDAARLIVVLAIGVLLLAGPPVLRRWQSARLARLAAARPFARLVAPGKPAVVAFTTPRCHECRTRQKPALERLRLRAADAIDIVILDATSHDDLVDRLGILTVPATVVVDGSGAVRRINLGYVDEHALAAQLA
jgi:thiol-disulfide isomerase/thioredoxin